MAFIVCTVKYGLILRSNFWKLLQIHEHERLQIHLKTTVVKTALVKKIKKTLPFSLEFVKKFLRSP